MNMPTPTLEEVLALAGRWSNEERYRLWLACGQHDWQSLPRTATGGAPPPHYCPICLCVWTYTGALINAPLRSDE